MNPTSLESIGYFVRGERVEAEIETCFEERKALLAQQKQYKFEDAKPSSFEEEREVRFRALRCECETFRSRVLNVISLWNDMVKIYRENYRKAIELGEKDSRDKIYDDLMKLISTIEGAWGRIDYPTTSED